MEDFKELEKRLNDYHLKLKNDIKRGVMLEAYPKTKKYLEIGDQLFSLKEEEIYQITDINKDGVYLTPYTIYGKKEGWHTVAQIEKYIYVRYNGINSKEDTELRRGEELILRKLKLD